MSNSAPDTFIPRSAWTSTSRGGGTLNTPVSRLFVHHTADSGPYGGANASLATEQAYWRSVRNFHVNTRGWSDIAYSGGICPSGRVYDLRGFDRTGGHTLNYNSIGVAIVYAGNTMVTPVSDEVIDAYRKAIFELKQGPWVTDNLTIQGHRDVGNTSCPGDDLYSKLSRIRQPWDGGDSGVSVEDVREAFGVTSANTLPRLTQFLAGQLDHEAKRKREDIDPANQARLDGWDYAERSAGPKP